MMDPRLPGQPLLLDERARQDQRARQERRRTEQAQHARDDLRRRIIIGVTLLVIWIVLAFLLLRFT